MGGTDYEKWKSYVGSKLRMEEKFSSELRDGKTLMILRSSSIPWLMSECTSLQIKKRQENKKQTVWGRLASLEKGEQFSLIAEVGGKVVANSEITKRGGYSKHVGG